MKRKMSHKPKKMEMPSEHQGARHIMEGGHMMPEAEMQRSPKKPPAKKRK